MGDGAGQGRDHVRPEGFGKGQVAACHPGDGDNRTVRFGMGR